MTATLRPVGAMPPAFRPSPSALLLVGLVHIVILAAFLRPVIVVSRHESVASRTEETQILLARPAQPPPPQPGRRSGGSRAPAPVYFNPYTYNSPNAITLAPPKLAAALSACDPAHYDMASRDVRRLCDRIGALIAYDPGRFGFTSDVRDARHWQVELARREAPFLAPCMSPYGGLDVIYTLSCIYENLFIGYRPEHRRRYVE